MQKLGIIIPSITDPLQSELIDGVCKSAFPRGFDVIVMTNTTHADVFDFQNDYTTGEENIYDLIENGIFDGLLYVSQYFHKPELQERIVSMIRKSGVPCVEIGDTVPEFAHVSIGQRQAMYEITAHLITVHRCRDLCCLTGPETIPDAQERLVGFLAAVMAHDIELPEDAVIYGDFWKNSGERLGREIASGQRRKPEAVVCANDMMAVSLCDALAEGGISVPEDMLVTGYDAHIEAISHFPSVTTIGGQNWESGRLAAEKLCAMIAGAEIPEERSHLKLIFGASCGCLERSADYRQATMQVQHFMPGSSSVCGGSCTLPRSSIGHSPEWRGS